MSWVNDIRNDVATAIEALPALAGETIVRSWVPEVDRNKMTKREIHISPESRILSVASRACRRQTFTVWVAVVDPFARTGSEDAQAESGSSIADAIAFGLLTTYVGTSRAMVTAVEQPIVASVQHWRELRSFASFLKLTLEA